MFPSDFDYVVPTSLNEALGVLAKNPEAKLLAGGHSLLPMMKLRLTQPTLLVDIRKIPDLRGIEAANGGVRIGAYTTYHEIATSDVIARISPMLKECAEEVGDPQVRNRGTIGGSLAHADPGADMPAVILALGAQMAVTGPNGNRTIAADDFFVDMLQSALQPGEVLTHITIPAMPAKMGDAYEKFKHPASGYAIVGVAAMVHRGADGAVSECRIGVTGAGPKAQRAHAAETALQGNVDVVAAAARAADGLEFNGDITASETYRAHLTTVLTKRALQRALERSNG